MTFSPGSGRCSAPARGSLCNLLEAHRHDGRCAPGGGAGSAARRLRSLTRRARWGCCGRAAGPRRARVPTARRVLPARLGRLGRAAMREGARVPGFEHRPVLPLGVVGAPGRRRRRGDLRCDGPASATISAGSWPCLGCCIDQQQQQQQQKGPRAAAAAGRGARRGTTSDSARSNAAGAAGAGTGAVGARRLRSERRRSSMRCGQRRVRPWRSEERTHGDCRCRSARGGQRGALIAPECTWGGELPGTSWLLPEP
jgi:hypothetical protein